MSEDLLLRNIADRLAIGDVLSRYATIVDTREWSALSEVFTEDATVDYTSTGGKAGSVASVMEWLDRALAPWPVNLHCITNISIEFEGDRATSRAYFHAPMASGELGDQLVITNAGTYDDRWARTSAGWRIDGRVCRQTLMLGSLPEGYAIPD